MYWTRFTIAVPVLSAALCLSQDVQGSQTLLLKEVHFSGDLGESADELGKYTKFLTGHRLEREKLLEDASSAVSKALRHRGYLKAQVTPQLQPLKPSPGSKDAEVALELTIKAGKQYRVKDLTFVGLSSQLAERDLKQACTIHSGETADGEEIGSCLHNLRTLFRQKGQDVFVVPSMKFDDAASTVSLQLDVEK
ncbi:MAG TPA: POTRA domain-containing protein [Candidatus Sulfotelmatobacter sp.]|nr:POTRA domain-containing protein [Candidatus Sulfotelmatobacter sp.]